MDNDSELILKPDPTIDNRIEEQRCKIKSDIEKYIKNSTENEEILKGIQGRINELDNLISYKNNSQDPAFAECINLLTQQSMPYGDRDINAYISSFPGSYGRMLFESAMFQLLSDHENLEAIDRKNNIKIKSKKSDTPDYSFKDKEGGVIHYIECTTNTTGSFSEFVKILPSIDHYFNAAMLVYKSSKEKRKLYNRSTEWHGEREHAVRELSENEKETFIKHISLMKSETCRLTLEQAIEAFLTYTDIIEYANCYYSDLINEEIKEKLKQIEFSSFHSIGTEAHFQLKKSVTESIAACLIGKMKEKEYFKAGDPITLCISFALRRELIVRALIANGLFSYLQENLNHCIAERVLKEGYSKEEYNRIIQNLYAIILDGSWYNWCPEIAIQRSRASFPDENNNTYFGIYNQNHPLVKEGKLIYKKVWKTELYSFAQLV